MSRLERVEIPGDSISFAHAPDNDNQRVRLEIRAGSRIDSHFVSYVGYRVDRKTTRVAPYPRAGSGW